MKVHYHSPSDLLHLTLSPAASVESEEVREGFVFDYDAQGRVVAMEVHGASRRLDLSRLEGDPAFVRTEAEEGVEIRTVAMLAEELDVSPRALQLTLKSMRAAGIEVGSQVGASSTVLLDSEDAGRISKWRKAHPRGRPRSTCSASARAEALGGSGNTRG